MKKYLLSFATLCSLLTVVLLTGCNNNPDKQEDKTTPPPSTTTTSISDTQSSEPELTTTPEVTTTTPTEETTTTPVTSKPQVPSSPIDENNSVVKTALALIGTPFTDGGSTPEDGFDNSGFIYYVLRENGFINFPRLISEQVKMGDNIAYDELLPGDLVYFSSDDSGNAHFGGIYIGDGTMIYSPMPGEVVKEANIGTSYWTTHFATAISLR